MLYSRGLKNSDWDQKVIRELFFSKVSNHGVGLFCHNLTYNLTTFSDQQSRLGTGLRKNTGLRHLRIGFTFQTWKLFPYFIQFMSNKKTVHSFNPHSKTTLWPWNEGWRSEQSAVVTSVLKCEMKALLTTHDPVIPVLFVSLCIFRVRRGTVSACSPGCGVT